jgi:hypothetical protein
MRHRWRRFCLCFMDRSGTFVVLWGAFGGDLVRLVAALWILLHGYRGRSATRPSRVVYFALLLWIANKTEVVCGAYAGDSAGRRLVG